MANPLRELAEFDQSFWLDYLSRPLITSGELADLIENDGLRGMTSNPTIFEKALSTTDEYDMEIRRLIAASESNEAIFEDLAIHDVQMAADLLRPVYDGSQGQDGFVSLELPPSLAYQTEESIRQARRLFAKINRPNVLIKVPGTPEGLPAIEELIAEGVNVNITLLFSVDTYEKVAEAYIRGLERRVAQGKPVDRIASVASFFVSRVDTQVDRRIDEMLAKTSDPDRRKALESLRGETAIANAKIAYQRCKRIFLEGERFRTLEAQHGARIQRPLWASTSTKNPAYSDVKYIEALIGPHTVETMAPASVAAFRDHGVVRATLDRDVDEAYRTLETLAEVGISYDEVTRTLQKDGVESFAQSFDNILAGIERKRVSLTGPSEGSTVSPSPFDSEVRSAVERLAAGDFIERLWQRDPGLWTTEPAARKTIENRLGWMTVYQTMLDRIKEFDDLAADIKSEDFTTVLLLGMGGSSLAPEVFQRIFGNQIGFPELVVVDTTDPDAILKIQHSVDLDRSLFIVSTKSGTTVETLSLFQYFYSLMTDRLGAEAGKRFIAITDPGTALESIAKNSGFRYLFLNPPDIGGRYSALSYFGLVPAAVIGLNIRRLLEPVFPMAHRSRESSPENPALQLGTALGLLVQAGIDKATFVLDPAIASLADWVEQLLAESTGKQGTGLIPIVHEPEGAPGSYGSDRFFVGIDLAPQPNADTDAFLAGVETAGHPVIRLRLASDWELGAELFRWELATAIAGSILGINPFDEPNVKESKDNTNRLLDEYQEQHRLPALPVAATEDGVEASGVSATSIREALERFLDQITDGEYLAIMAFAERDPETERRLVEMRGLLRERLRVATTLGYGPRFLHSIGQLYKGGPPTGAFLQILVEPRQDIPIPGQEYSFGTLFRAQALGDYQALATRGRPLLRLTLSGDPVRGLDRVLEALIVAATR